MVTPGKQHRGCTRTVPSHRRGYSAERNTFTKQNAEQDKGSLLAITDSNFIRKQDKEKRAAGQFAYVCGYWVLQRQSHYFVTISVSESELTAASLLCVPGSGLMRATSSGLQVPEIWTIFPLLIDDQQTEFNAGVFCVQCIKHVAASEHS